MMTYKGYHGTVTFDEDAETFHGEVTDLRDVVTFQGRSVDELKAAFHESIDDYLEFCAERGASSSQSGRGFEPQSLGRIETGNTNKPKRITSRIWRRRVSRLIEFGASHRRRHCFNVLIFGRRLCGHLWVTARRLF